ncbi:MAG: tetraacyldisaccharide 4'-kinase [Acidobacteriota bacterium]|nr:tetraacyldisaccharide 4'-kinase [Acidobacteriota bacterium]
MSGARHPRPWLSPVGRLYLAAAGWHHRRWDRRRPGRAPLPVISLGNLAAGGTGKTPMTLWLAARLTAEGRKPAVVSRGYGGRRRKDPLVVSRGARIQATVDEAGDEAMMIARRQVAGLVVVARRRLEGCALARDEGADVAVLDDGFQHRALARELDIVLLDAADPLGGGRGLPAGWLREPPRGLARADVLILTRAPSELAAHTVPLAAGALPAALRETLAALPAEHVPPVLAATHRPGRLLIPGQDPAPPQRLAGERVLAVSGIARPETFRATLEGLRARVLDHLAWPDHHRFGTREAAAITRAAARCRARWIVTTEKDAVRWPESAPRPTVLTVDFEIGAGAWLLERCRQALEERTP